MGSRLSRIGQWWLRKHQHPGCHHSAQWCARPEPRWV